MFPTAHVVFGLAIIKDYLRKVHCGTTNNVCEKCCYDNAKVDHDYWVNRRCDSVNDIPANFFAVRPRVAISDSEIFGVHACRQCTNSRFCDDG
jgi:hypothetical protein